MLETCCSCLIYPCGTTLATLATLATSVLKVIDTYSLCVWRRDCNENSKQDSDVRVTVRP